LIYKGSKTYTNIDEM